MPPRSAALVALAALTPFELVAAGVDVDAHAASEVTTTAARAAPTILRWVITDVLLVDGAAVRAVADRDAAAQPPRIVIAFG
jgi:hypothetical protein